MAEKSTRQRVTIPREKYGELQKQLSTAYLNLATAERERDLQKEYAQAHQRKLQQLTAYVKVLEGDRDRLTAALEITTRRLASPWADHDPSRATGRHNTVERITDEDIHGRRSS